MIHTVAPLVDKRCHTIILLHGHDSVAEEFAEEFFENQASDDRTLPEIFPAVRWVFPTSKLRKSARFEVEMSQWFDMWSVEEPSEKEEIQIGGLRESIGYILDLIRSEASLISPEHIILGGISQGCATAMHVMLYGGIQLGGFLGFCTWLAFHNDIVAIIGRQFAKADTLKHIRSVFDRSVSDSNVPLPLSNMSAKSAFATPIFLSHSQDDEVVAINHGESLYQTLRDIGFDITWKTYQDGGHWINEPQGIDDVVAFLHDKVRIE